jgi:DtxR family Mn-dependent transcriptional regulator
MNEADHSLNEPEEMFLERLWCLKEMEKNAQRSLIGTHDCEQRRAFLNQFLKSQYLTLERDLVDFTDKGHAYAQDIIRRRRLTEILLYNVLEINLDTVETSACKIEHIINQEVTDSICSFLGHPLQCPHGKPIPKGNCCQQQTDNLKPLIEPLKNFPIGKKARIVFIKTSKGVVLHRLSSLGLYPGVVVNIRQHRPTPILSIGETDIALEPDLVEGIFCRPIK